MNLAEIITRLDTLEPARVMDATQLLIELRGHRPDDTAIIEIQPRLEAAILALREHIHLAEDLVKRCQRLAPVAGRPPEGF